MTNLTFGIIIVLAVFAGYCFGRAHAALASIDNFIKANNDTTSL